MNTNIDYLAAKYNGSLNIGYVDCVKEKALCEKYQVHYFPAIKYVMSNYVHDYFGRTSLRSLIEMCDSLNSSAFVSLDIAAESITMISDDAAYTTLIHSSQVVFLCVYVSSVLCVRSIGQLFFRRAALFPLPERLSVFASLHGTFFLSPISL